MKKVSIIIPCYNEEEALNIVHEAIVQEMEQLKEYDYELLLVNDGSSDGTLKEMKRLAAENAHVKYYSFSRNCGWSHIRCEDEAFRSGNIRPLVAGTNQWPHQPSEGCSLHRASLSHNRTNPAFFDS